MADYTKKPIGRSLNKVAENAAREAISLTGRALPCTIAKVVSSGIVTVNFEVNAAPFTLPQVTVPIVGSEYVRLPLRVGDKGMVISADVRLGGITGLGAGVPDLTRPANLAALAFVYLGSTEWTTPDDANAVVVYGPNGVVLRDTASTHKLTVNSTHVDVDGNLIVNGNKFAAFGGSPATKQTITGALSAVTDGNAKAVLTSIIAMLTANSLASNGTT